MAKTKTSYNLSMPTETYKSLRNIAEQEGTTIADLLRRATKLLLFIRSIKHEGGRLLVERGGDLQEILLDFI